MTDLINIAISPPTFATIVNCPQSQYGGNLYSIVINQEVLDNLEWLRTYRSQLEREAIAREKNPALASQYEQYQTMLRIVMDDV